MYRILSLLCSFFLISSSCYGTQPSPRTLQGPSFTKKPKKGKRGHRGQTGKRGFQGSQGHTGPEGTNETGALNPAYLSAFQVSGTSIEPNDNITFPNVIENTGFSYNPTTGVFTTTNGTGFYDITFGAVWRPLRGITSPIVLLVNGVEVTGSLIFPTKELDHSSLSLIIPITIPNSTIEIRNRASEIIELSSPEDGSSSAYITITKIR